MSDLASRAQAREKLARAIHASMCHISWEDCVEEERTCFRAADAVLAPKAFARLAGLLGYVKADGERWAICEEDGSLELGDYDGGFETRAEAESYRARWFDRDTPLTVVRRQFGPWEVVAGE
ncbi:hypothetical protein ACFWQG_13155 [Rhodococcus sp. NPDC058532]|uniref:hypothetical protein n=1 Tax=Rhodococcus sp. NPDC058532 TaxID=3346540 RepID=UPI003668C4A1